MTQRGHNLDGLPHSTPLCWPDYHKDKTTYT